MRKIFHKLHLWLSIPFGLIISIICISGALLVFETEIMEILYRDRYKVENIATDPLPVEELIARVSATLPDSVSVSSVTISSNPGRAYQMGLSKPRRASVYVDQYTGEIKWHYKRAGFFTFMFRTHRWLLDSMKPGSTVFVGKIVVGVSTLIFVFILITGIAIWIPRKWKSVKHRLKISTKKGAKRFWYDLHIAGGFYAVLLLLAMALTGLTWSFSWYRDGFYKVFGVEVQPHGQQPQAANPGQQQAGGPVGENSPQAGGAGNREARDDNNREERQARGAGDRDVRPDNSQQERHTGVQANREDNRDARPRRDNTQAALPYLLWETVYRQLASENPAFDRISVSDGSANVYFDRWGNQRGSDRYGFDKTSGNITERSPYKDQEKSSKIRGWIYSVHVGSWGGLFSKILTFIAALIGGALPITGYWIWLRKRPKKKGRRAHAEMK